MLGGMSTISGKELNNKVSVLHSAVYFKGCFLLYVEGMSGAVADGKFSLSTSGKVKIHCFLVSYTVFRPIGHTLRVQLYLRNQ